MMLVLMRYDFYLVVIGDVYWMEGNKDLEMECFVVDIVERSINVVIGILIFV